jgi:hypothetical protein
MELKDAIKMLSILCSEKQEEKDVPSKLINFIGKRIYILQRGWVVVGDAYQSGENITLESAAVVRNWGTTKGLGELAENGPIKDKTVLDPCPTVHIHELAVVASMSCNAHKWTEIK